MAQPWNTLATHSGIDGAAHKSKGDGCHALGGCQNSKSRRHLYAHFGSGRSHLSKKRCISINFLPPRLETIMDFDQVVVLEKGSVAEQGSAQELRQKPQGLFRRMLAAKRWWWGWGLGGALGMGDTKPQMDDFIIFPMNTWYFKGFFRQTPHFQTRARWRMTRIYGRTSKDGKPRKEIICWLL